MREKVLSINMYLENLTEAALAELGEQAIASDDDALLLVLHSPTALLRSGKAPSGGG